MSYAQLGTNDFSTASALQTDNGQAIQWLNPAQATQNPLPIVANSGDDLLLLWMQDGVILETEQIVESGRLIGLPNILITENTIAVSWAQVTAYAYANLFYSSRRR